MFVLILLVFQFYFLAKRFDKNRMKVVLSVVGLFALGIIVLSFNLALLMMTGVVTSDIEELMKQEWINIIPSAILFILIGVIYYWYLAKKWSTELHDEIKVKIEGEIKEVLEKKSLNFPVPTTKLDVYCHFHTVNESNIHLIKPLATAIWKATYSEILEPEQMTYMLDQMYSDEKILSDIAQGDQWEILKADNVAVGYLHFKIDEERVFLSKIYLKQDSQLKGIGQLMLNHVVQYALDNKKKAVYLTVNKNNAKAIRFYTKNNFKNIDSKVFEIGNGYVMDDYIFQKDLD